MASDIEARLKTLYTAPRRWPHHEGRGEEARRLRWMREWDYDSRHHDRMMRVSIGLSPYNTVAIDWCGDDVESVTITRRTSLQSRLEVYEAMDAGRLEWIPVYHEQVEDILTDRTGKYPTLLDRSEALWEIVANADPEDWVLVERARQAACCLDREQIEAEKRITSDALTIARRKTQTVF